MATIPKSVLDFYESELDAIESDARKRIEKVLSRVDWADVASSRATVVQAAQMLLQVHTELAAQAAADLYKAIRDSQGVASDYAPKALPGYAPEATEASIRAFASHMTADGIAAAGGQAGAQAMFDAAVAERMSYEIRRAAGNSMLENGLADPSRPRFARVPQGGDTCDFCIMLASRGFVYLTRETAGEFDHYHDHCRCKVVPSWKAAEVEGYDPDALYEQYLANKERKAGDRRERGEDG